MTTAKLLPRHRLLPLIVACLGLLCVLTLGTGRADAASAQLLQRQANSVVVQINLEQPAPANLIAELYFPPGVQIVSASPHPAKIDRNRGVVRWLLKATRPGTQLLQVSGNQPLRLSDFSARIRYRQPGSGQMVEINASQ